MSITNILETLRREQKTRKQSCTPCNEAISQVSNQLKNLKEHTDVIRDMYKGQIHKMKLKDGITYTIDDIMQKIYVDNCWIEENLKRYQKCCKEGKLSELEKFKC